jgi:hypothetical protein
MMVTFKKGDCVRMSPMWKYDEASGTVIKITSEYIIVKWNNINGEWHYTPIQAQALEVI